MWWIIIALLFLFLKRGMALNAEEFLKEAANFSQLNQKYVQGLTIFLKDFSYAVSIKVRLKDSQLHHKCVGSIITEKHIFSSCSCFCNWNFTSMKLQFFRLTNFQVFAGSLNLMFPTSQTQVRNLVRLHIYPDCRRYPSKEWWDYNFAAAEVDEPFFMEPFLQIVSMYWREKAVAVLALTTFKDFNPCKTIGWGKETGIYKNSLKIVALRILPQVTCIKRTCTILNSSNSCELSIENDDDQHICGEVLNQNFSICDADLGSPLLCGGVIWGIVDWIPHDCSSPSAVIAFSLIGSSKSFFLEQIMYKSYSTNFQQPTNLITFFNLLIYINKIR